MFLYWCLEGFCFALGWIHVEWYQLIDSLDNTVLDRRHIL